MAHSIDMSCTAIDTSGRGIQCKDVGRVLKAGLRKPNAVDVIFVPGMGIPRENEAYEFWNNINMWFREWTTFYTGQDCHHSYTELPPPTATINANTKMRIILTIPTSILTYPFLVTMFYSLLLYSILFYSRMFLSDVGCFVECLGLYSNAY